MTDKMEYTLITVKGLLFDMDGTVSFFRSFDSEIQGTYVLMARSCAEPELFS